MGRERRDQEMEKRSESSKVRRVEGESRGEIVSEMPIDEMDEDTWEQKKETIREEKVPFLVIKGQHARRAIQASKIQDLMGEYYVCEMPRARQDVEVVEKMNYIGGEAVVIGDTKVWTNSEEVKRSIREELRRRTIRGKIVDNENGVPWGRIVGEAVRRQVENRELGEVNSIEKEAKYLPGIMLREKEEEKEVLEVYYVAAFGNY